MQAVRRKLAGNTPRGKNMTCTHAQGIRRFVFSDGQQIECCPCGCPVTFTDRDGKSVTVLYNCEYGLAERFCTERTKLA